MRHIITPNTPGLNLGNPLCYEYHSTGIHYGAFGVLEKLISQISATVNQTLYIIQNPTCKPLVHRWRYQKILPIRQSQYWFSFYTSLYSVPYYYYHPIH